MNLKIVPSELICLKNREGKSCQFQLKWLRKVAEPSLGDRVEEPQGLGIGQCVPGQRCQRHAGPAWHHGSCMFIPALDQSTPVNLLFKTYIYNYRSLFFYMTLLYFIHCLIYDSAWVLGCYTKSAFHELDLLEHRLSQPPSIFFSSRRTSASSHERCAWAEKPMDSSVSDFSDVFLPGTRSLGRRWTIAERRRKSENNWHLGRWKATHSAGHGRMKKLKDGLETLRKIM